MRFSVAVSAAALAAGVSASYNGTSVAPVYVTEVVSEYTTYCPESTQISHNGITYTVSEATTLTITNCPCTVTKPATSTTPAAPLSTYSAAPVSSSSSAVVAPVSTYSAPVYSNGTTATTVAPVGTATGATSVTSPVATFTGAANKAVSGAGLAAIFGLAAYAL